MVEVEVEMLPESDKGGRGVDERENEGNRRITKEVVGKIQLRKVCEGGCVSDIIMANKKGFQGECKR